jgi:hypothetical protein
MNKIYILYLIRYLFLRIYFSFSFLWLSVNIIANNRDTIDNDRYDFKHVTLSWLAIETKNNDCKVQGRKKGV